MDKKGEHVCKMDKKGYCVNEILSSKALEILEKIKAEYDESGIEYLDPSKLVCNECNHKGMLTGPVLGVAIGAKKDSQPCHGRSEFAICPQCGHWGMILRPGKVQPGTRL